MYFLWVGGENSGKNYGKLWHDITCSGMEEYVRFLGVQVNPLQYFAMCDVFVMISREEPFGLVCIEAASCGRPVICFDKSGGPQEFVENDCGYVVPYLDMETMATRVLELLRDSQLRQQFGQRENKRFRKVIG